MMDKCTRNNISCLRAILSRMLLLPHQAGMDDRMNMVGTRNVLELRNREWPSLACRAICRLFFRHVVRIIKYVVEC
jgi:hypothetical protein